MILVEMYKNEFQENSPGLWLWGTETRKTRNYRSGCAAAL
jgi:hypothetical protein